MIVHSLVESTNVTLKGVKGTLGPPNSCGCKSIYLLRPAFDTRFGYSRVHIVSCNRYTESIALPCRRHITSRPGSEPKVCSLVLAKEKKLVRDFTF